MKHILLGLIGWAVLATSASAANRHVDIVNDTGMAIVAFHASNTGTSDWEEDILERDIIEPGETFPIDIDDGSGACRFDFKAVFENGTELVKHNIDVCRIATFTYTR